MNAFGVRPGIILLREGTDTSQVRSYKFRCRSESKKMLPNLGDVFCFSFVLHDFVWVSSVFCMV
jgi:hypothetical protein